MHVHEPLLQALLVGEEAQRVTEGGGYRAILLAQIAPTVQQDGDGPHNGDGECAEHCTRALKGLLGHISDTKQGRPSRTPVAVEGGALCIYVDAASPGRRALPVEDCDVIVNTLRISPGSCPEGGSSVVAALLTTAVTVQ